MPDQPVTLQPLNFKSPSCADCRFCVDDPDMAQAIGATNLKAAPQGICVRFPPQSQIIGTQQGPMAMMVKSVVPKTHWCGEFKLRLVAG